MNSAQVVEPIAQHLPPRTVPDNKCRFLEKVSLGIAADGDDIDFLACDSGDFQATADRHLWKSGKVLHAAEAFFFQSRNELAVADEYGRRVGVIDVDA